MPKRTAQLLLNRSQPFFEKEHVKFCISSRAEVFYKTEGWGVSGGKASVECLPGFLMWVCERTLCCAEQCLLTLLCRSASREMLHEVVLSAMSGFAEPLMRCDRCIEPDPNCNQSSRGGGGGGTLDASGCVPSLSQSLSAASTVPLRRLRKGDLTPRPHRVRQRITHSFYNIPHHAPAHVWGLEPQ